MDIVDLAERLRNGHKFGDSDVVLEAAKVLEELKAALTAEIKNKQEFERDWLECCDKLNEERRIHLELEEVLVKKLEASQAREKALNAMAGKFLSQLMDVAVANWANSVSMPDEYVEAALFLSQPSDDTALRAALAAERERCCDVVDRCVNDSRDAHDAIKAIRELGD